MPVKLGTGFSQVSTEETEEKAVAGFQEPGEELDRLAREVVGEAIEVHRALGPGLLESVYENALCVELELRGIGYIRQPQVDLFYKNRHVGRGRLDLLVENELVLELKAVEAINDAHRAQVISYLKTTRFRLGPLINFNVPRLRDGIKRIICS